MSLVQEPSFSFVGDRWPYALLGPREEDQHPRLVPLFGTWEVDLILTKEFFGDAAATNVSDRLVLEFVPLELDGIESLRLAVSSQSGRIRSRDFKVYHSEKEILGETKDGTALIRLMYSGSDLDSGLLSIKSSDHVCHVTLEKFRKISGAQTQQPFG